MKKVKLGVIGVGGMGTAHVNSMEKIPEVALTCVCDVDQNVAEKMGKEKKIPYFTDYRNIIDSGNCSAVIVATHHYLHPPISIYAMKKGLHVLSEKPISVKVKEADEMIRVAKKTKVVFGVMLQMRSFPYLIAAKQIIQSGKIGEIYRTLLVSTGVRAMAYYNSAEWRGTYKGEGGGVLTNQAPHVLDYFLWIAGMPASLQGWVRTRAHDIEVEDEAHAIVDYANGARGYFHTSTAECPASDIFEVCGEKGKLTCINGKLVLEMLEKPLKKFINTTPDMWASPKVAEEPVVLPDSQVGHGTIIRNFARAILEGEPLIAPGEEGLNSVELANAIVLSSKTKKPVNIPLNREIVDDLFVKLMKTSKPKKISGQALRVTDPKHVNK